MTATKDDLLHSAFVAHAAGKFANQADFSAQALALDESSAGAAILYFHAQWSMGNEVQAADYITAYASRYGAPGGVIHCLVLAAMVQNQDEAAVEHAATWFERMSKDDIRVVRKNLEPSDFRILKRTSLASSAATVGPKISERFEAFGAVKSMLPSAMPLRSAQPSYCVVQNVTAVASEWYLYDESAVYFDELQGWPQKFEQVRMFLPPHSASLLAIAGGRVLTTAPRSVRRIEEPCILLGGYPNYYYWLTEYVARLVSIDGIYDFRSMPILVDQDLPSTHLESLAQLGINPENIIPCAAGSAVHCSELIVPTVLSAVDVVHPAAIKWLRDQFGPKGRDSSYPDRIFISRQKPHRRHLLNEDEVFAHLQPLGFTKVSPDTLSFVEQNSIFQNADVVIGPFGTCLTSVLFAPESCSIFEIIDEPSIPVHRYIENIAIHIGQKFECVLTPAEKHKKSRNSSDYDFRLPPDGLVAQIRPHLDALD